MITRAPGVGPKLAARILAELKDKVTGFENFSSPTSLKAESSAPKGILEDAVSALTNLGYHRGEACGAVTGAMRTIGADPGVEDLIRAGLKELTA